MPYQTGTVNDFAGLKTTMFSFLTSNSWTQETDIIKRNGVYAKIEVASVSGQTILKLTGGKSSDGAGNLISPQSGMFPDIGGIADSTFQAINTSFGTGSTDGMIFPIIYHFHLATAPDEFWCIIEYNGGLFQHFGFGNLLKATDYSGGGFYSASKNARADFSATLSPFGASIYGDLWYGEFYPFHIQQTSVHGGSCVHAEVGGRDWHCSTEVNNQDTCNMRASFDEMKSSESGVNGMPNLIPFRLWMQTTPLSDDSYQYLGVMNNIRFCEIAFIDAGQVESDGTDSWKFYPCLRKDTDHPTGWANPASSGIGGLAIRYDGP
tara:strand:+ start:692 stop:1654 length:963 start_codon:yes stop_codon:yes gene_type:complete